MFGPLPLLFVLSCSGRRGSLGRARARGRRHDGVGAVLGLVGHRALVVLCNRFEVGGVGGFGERLPRVFLVSGGDGEVVDWVCSLTLEALASRADRRRAMMMAEGVASRVSQSVDDGSWGNLGPLCRFPLGLGLHWVADEDQSLPKGVCEGLRCLCAATF